MTKIKWHRPPLFGCMKFAFCPDVEAWEAERKRVLRQDAIDIAEYPTTTGMCVTWEDFTSTKRTLITLHAELDSDPIELISTISHECFHLACRVLEAAAEDDAGEETVAYMVGGLVKTIWSDYCLTRGKANFPQVAAK